MPFFSVVIPTYNRANFLAGSIDSVLAQHYKDFELIIVDDGSTDHTSELIRNYDHESRLKYFLKENEERGAARNFGFRKSQGKYVVFLDSDDLMLPDHLMVLAENIKANPEVNFLATKYEFINEKNDRSHSDTTKMKPGRYNYEIFLKGNFLACNVCVKRSHPDLKLFVEDRRYAVMEDWMFFVQNLRQEPLLLIRQCTVLMKDHVGRSMRSDHEIINKRMLATQWITKNVEMPTLQCRIMEGFSNYFCAIHSYIDGEAWKGIKYLSVAFKKVGPRAAFFILLIKLLVGHKNINQLTSRS